MSHTTSAPTSGNEWPTGGTKINSATMTGLTAGSTYYIFTRYKETATNMAGSRSRSSSGADGRDHQAEPNHPDGRER